MKYQSEIIKEIVDNRGHEKSSLHYESECVEYWIEETKGSYPKLTDYESEWLNYIEENHIGMFPYITLSDETNATVENVVPYSYKSAILKGSTKYRDIDTGEFLETFEDGRNLELVSVKMPVLTTTGKNLFHGIMTRGQLLSNNVIKSNVTKMGYSEFLPINEDLNIYCSYYTNSTYIIEKIYFYDENKNQISTNTKPRKVTTPKGTKYFRISVTTTDWNSEVVFDDIKDDFNIQVEIGTQATSYEPYKSNILSTSEDVTLRRIGDTQDTLDLLTGELSQRVDKTVLDGTNTPNIMFLEPNRAEGYTVFPMQISDVFPNMPANYNNNTQLISNNFNYLVGGYLNRLAGKWMCINAMYFVLSISNDELESLDVQGLNKWLSLNKTTIYYPSEKSIKTVDLTITNQDGETLNKIKPIEGTMHIATDGNPIKPLFSGEIPVEAITQNLATFIKE